MSKLLLKLNFVKLEFRDFLYFYICFNNEVVRKTIGILINMSSNLKIKK